MKPRLLAIVATLLTTALAGCVGQFEVIQTEPIRIQIDDADGEESRIGAAGCCPGENASEKQEFEFEAPDDVEKVVVIVEVTKVTTQGGASPTTATPATTGNGTGNQTTSPPAGNQTSGEPCIVLVIVQEKDSGRKLAEERVDASDESATANIDVDVRGNNNIVVIMQAVEGSADVNVAAKRAEAGDTTASPTTSPANTTSPTPR